MTSNCIPLAREVRPRPRFHAASDRSWTYVSSLIHFADAFSRMRQYAVTGTQVNTDVKKVEIPC